MSSKNIIYRKSIKKKNRKQPPRVQYPWTDGDIFKLIAAVEENLCLWDTRRNDNKDLIQRNAAWRRISEDVFKEQITVEQLKVN